MSDPSVDRRIVRTKRMIRDALTELIEEKGFEGITVRDLTAKADINRGTFYLHYRDKYDLLEQSENEIFRELQEIIEDVEEYPPQDALHKQEQHDPIPFVIKLFEYVLENADFMKVMLGPNGDPSFQTKLKEVIRNNMLKIMDKLLKKENMIVPVEYLVTYVSSAHLGVIQHWLESGMNESPREMAVVLSTITILGPRNVLGIEQNNAKR